MSSISFWTPVKYGNRPTLLQKATEFVDDYFYLGGRVAHVMPEGKVVLGSGRAKGWQTVLKVISYGAVFINLLATTQFPGLKQSRTIAQFQTLLNWFPVGMLVTKVVLRLISRFEIKPPQLVPDRPHATKLQLIPELSSDLNLEILKFLDPKDLGKASLVCKGWRELASTESLWKAFNLKQLFPKLSVIDKNVWETHVDLKAYGLSCEGEGDPRKVIQGLYKMYASLQIKQDAGITLLTMPQGLTFNKLRDFANSPDSGMDIDFTQHCSLLNFGDDSVNKTYQIAITNDILKGSEMLGSANQTGFNFFKDDVQTLKNHVQSLKYDMPEVLEASTRAILTCISSTATTRFHKIEWPMITQQCSESREQFYQIMRFKDPTFNLHIKGLPFSEFITFPNFITSPNKSFGVGAVQKFKVIDSK